MRQPITKSFSYKGDTYEIPIDKVSDFLKDNKGAKEVATFVVGKDEYDIPFDMIDAFMKDNPTASKKKGQEEPTQPPSATSSNGSEGVSSPSESGSIPTVITSDLNNPDAPLVPDKNLTPLQKDVISASGIPQATVDIESLNKSVQAKKDWASMSNEEKLRHNADVNKMWYDRTGNVKYLYDAADIYGKLGDKDNEIMWRSLADQKGKEGLKAVGGGSNQSDLQTYHNPTSPSTVNQTMDQLENFLSFGTKGEVDQVQAGLGKFDKKYSDLTSATIGAVSGLADIFMGTAMLATGSGASMAPAFGLAPQVAPPIAKAMELAGDAVKEKATQWNGGKKPEWADDAASLANVLAMAATMGVLHLGVSKAIDKANGNAIIKDAIDNMTPEKQQEIFGKVDALYQEYKDDPKAYHDAVKFNVEQAKQEAEVTPDRVPHPDEPVQEEVTPTVEPLKTEEDALQVKSPDAVDVGEPSRDGETVEQGNTAQGQPANEGTPTEGQGETDTQGSSPNPLAPEDQVTPTDAQLDDIATKVQNKQSLTAEEDNIFNDNLEQISNVIKGRNEVPVEEVQKRLSTKELSKRRNAPAISLRAWVLQQLTQGKVAISASDMKRYTGFDPSEFPKGTVKEDGVSMHSLWERLKDDPNLEFKADIEDSEKFANDVANVLTDYHDEKGMLKDLDNLQTKGGTNWKDAGFNNEADYLRDIEMRKEMDADRVAKEAYDPEIIKEQEEYIKNLTDDQVNQMLDDLYNNETNGQNRPTETVNETETGTATGETVGQSNEGETPPTEPPTGKPTSAEPAPVSDGGRGMGIAQAEINRQRMAKGLEELKSAGVGSDDTNLANAIERVSAMSDTDLDATIAQWSKKGTILNTEETFMLGLMNRMIESDIQKAIQENSEAQKGGYHGALNDEGRTNAKLVTLEDRQNKIQQIAFDVGSQWGGSGRARQILFNQDWTIQRLTNTFSRDTGIPEDAIPPKIMEELKSLQGQLSDLKAKADAEMNEISDKHAQEVAQLKLKLLEEKLKGEKSAARRAKTETNVAQRKLNLASNKEVSKARIEDIKKRASQILKDSRGQLNDVTTLLKTSKDFATVVKDLAAERVSIAMEEGEVKLANIMDQVYDDLADFHDYLTKRDIMDIFSGYGKTSDGSKRSDIEKQISRLKSEARYSAGESDVVEKGQLPKRSGYQREKEVPEIRAARQKMQEAMKQAGITWDNRSKAERMASALDRYKSTLFNRIQDLNRAIQEGKPIEKTRQTFELDDKARQLLESRNEMQQVYDELFGKNERKGLTDEQKLKMANKAIDELEARLNANDIGVRVREARSTENPELAAAWDKLDALRKELKSRRDEAAGKVDPEQRRLENAIKTQEKAINDLNDRLENQDISEKTKREPIDNPILNDLKEARKTRKALFEQMRNEIDPEYNNRKANEFKDKWYQNRIKSLEDQIKNKDFEEPTPKLKQEYPSTLKSRIEYNRKIGEYNAKRVKWRKEFKYSKERKIGESFVSLGRAGKLSYLATFPKLASFVAHRVVIDPIERMAIGRVADKILGKDFLSRTSGSEGASNLQVELKAITDAWDGLGKDTLKKVRTGKTDAEALYGDAYKAGIDTEVFDAIKTGFKKEGWGEKDATQKAMEITAALESFVASSHAIVKTPLQKVAWNRSFALRLAKLASEGVDINDPMVQFKARVESLPDGNRSILMQNNKAAQVFSQLVGYLDRTSDKGGAVGAGGSAGALVLKALFPIVKVGSNFLAESAFDYVGGVPISLMRYFLEKSHGFEKMTPEMADSIQRQLRKGILGGLIVSYYYMNPQLKGGYYQRGEKRKEGDLRAGEDKFLPKKLTHTPYDQAANLGSSIARMSSGMNKKEGQGEGQSVWYSLLQSIIGMFEEHPFMNTPTRAMKATESEKDAVKWAGDFVRGMVVPGFVQEGAALSDNLTHGQGVSIDNEMNRDPQSVWQGVEMGIPGLRGNVESKGGQRESLKLDPIDYKFLKDNNALDALTTGVPTTVWVDKKPVYLTDKQIEDIKKLRDEALPKALAEKRKYHMGLKKDKIHEHIVKKNTNVTKHVIWLYLGKPNPEGFTLTEPR